MTIPASNPLLADPTAPIGVLDSGLGGLSVLKALRQELPLEDFVYCADCAQAPWGDKSSDWIAARCAEICRMLVAQGVKSIVIACNTATAEAAESLRAAMSLPIIGIEPAVKPAAARSKTLSIGVLATTRTIRSARYRSLVARFAKDALVHSVAAPGLMECVERGDFDGPETMALLHHYLDPLRKAGIDKLVLGCTHYPFLAAAIRSIMGDGVELIEPGRAVAAVTRLRLEQNNTLRAANATPSVRFFVSGAREHSGVLNRLWAGAACVEELVL